MEFYLKNLIEKFRNAKGLKSIDTNSIEFMQEFQLWIKEQQNIGKDYIDFLDYLGLNFRESSCVEVGKGDYDTIVAPYETSLITTALPLFTVDESRVLIGNLRVYGSMPLLSRRMKDKNLIDVVPKDIKTYMIHNPSSIRTILGWENLHNSGRSNIIMGIFGSLYDNDIEYKIKELQIIKERLVSDDFKEDYVTDNGHYFYTIASNRPIKEMSLVKSRVM